MLERLADRGSPMSMVYLGHAHEVGKGLPIDNNEAEKWYRHAAESGSVFAYYCLGRLFLREKRYDDARTAFELAEADGDAPSIYYLGEIYRRGWGVERDLERAKKYFTRAAANGHLVSRGALAVMREREKSGISAWLRARLAALIYAWKAVGIGSRNGESDYRIRF